MANQTKSAPIRLPPWKLIGALVILVPTVAIACGIAQMIPAEDAPRTENMANGGQRYIFESMRGSVMPPVVAILVIAFTAVSVHVVPHDKSVEKPETSPPSGAWKPLFSVGRGLRLVIIVGCCLMIFLILLLVIVLRPLTSIRVIEVDRNQARFHSLLGTWSFPRAHVQQVEVQREDVERKRVQQADIQLTIQLIGGRAFSSTEASYSVGDPDLARHLGFLQTVKADLLAN